MLRDKFYQTFVKSYICECRPKHCRSGITLYTRVLQTCWTLSTAAEATHHIARKRQTSAETVVKWFVLRHCVNFCKSERVLVSKASCMSAFLSHTCWFVSVLCVRLNLDMYEAKQKSRVTFLVLFSSFYSKNSNIDVVLFLFVGGDGIISLHFGPD